VVHLNIAAHTRTKLK